MSINVSIINHSKSFSDADLQVLANALQIQVIRDFSNIWGTNCKVFWTPTGSFPTPDHWSVALLDNADQAGILGLHDVTPLGLPLGKVFVETTLNNGGIVSVTASHELLEMLVDPDINLTAELDDKSGAPSKFYAYETCDPCESNLDAYDVIIPAGWNGAGKVIKVSDFVTPAWFESFNKTGPYDFRKLLNAPFTLSPGGYISYLDLGNMSAGWQQLTRKAQMTSQAQAAARPYPGSRRSRRSLRRSEWLYSSYSTGVMAHPAEGYSLPAQFENYITNA